MATKKTKTIPESQITRPGANGGRLNAGAGPGRPKGSLSIRAEIKKQLAAAGGAKLQELVRGLIDAAAKGNVQALREIIRQTDDNGADLLELRGAVETTVPEGAPDPGRLTNEELATYIALRRKMSKDAEEDAAAG